MTAKQEVRLKRYEKINKSIKGRTFTSVVIFSLIISLAAITIGFYLYFSSVRREFRTRTWQMSRTAFHVLDREEVERQAEEVLSVYYFMSEEERQQLSDKHSPLLERFSGVYGEGFDEVCRILRQIQEDNGGMAAFTAFLDLEHNRRVFITDSDPNDTFCPPGSLDEMDPRIFEELMMGTSYFLDDVYGVGKMNATIFRMEPYGFRCMAGTIIAIIEGYPLFVFFDTDMNQAVNTGIVYFLLYVGVMILVTAAVLYFALKNMNRTVVEPINQLAIAAQQFGEERKKGNVRERFFAKLDINTGDEIENLSITMKEMESELGHYIRNLTQVTAERERISTELSLANRIQTSMLPHIFPPFPERSEIDIYGVMDPAKEIGGDFYDFYLIDDDHLGLVMADVSGKGIPAALFMMISKIIVQSYATEGGSPADILTKANETICSNNHEEMFVTTWLGILELSTGRLTAANAGHEYPILKQPGGIYEVVKDKHGLALGVMSGVSYKEYELMLQPGSSLFLYTDGLPEANNADNKQFGMERILRVLNSDEDTFAENVLARVRSGVDEFVQEAEQFDDLTMLCLRYRSTTAQPEVPAEE